MREFERVVTEYLGLAYLVGAKLTGTHIVYHNYKTDTAILMTDYGDISVHKTEELPQNTMVFVPVLIELVDKQDKMIKRAVKILAKENCPSVTPGEDGCDPDGCEACWMKELAKCKE